MDVLVLIVLLAVVAIGAVLVWRGGRRKPPDGTPHPLLASTKEEPAPAATTSLRARLGKSRSALAQRFTALGGRDRLGDGIWDEVEELLIAADVGAGTAAELVAGVREQRPSTVEALRAHLERDLAAILDGRERDLGLSGDPAVILVVGVNGSGKTTSVAKLAGLLAARGQDGSAGCSGYVPGRRVRSTRDVGRPGRREVVTGQDGADPAAVAFDALQAARARQADVLIVDTAGRLQTKSNLMAELGKVVRVLERETDRIDEVLLVVDGTTGRTPSARHAASSRWRT